MTGIDNFGVPLVVAGQGQAPERVPFPNAAVSIDVGFDGHAVVLARDQRERYFVSSAGSRTYLPTELDWASISAWSASASVVSGLVRAGAIYGMGYLAFVDNGVVRMSESMQLGEVRTSFSGGLFMGFPEELYFGSGLSSAGLVYLNSAAEVVHTLADLPKGFEGADFTAFSPVGEERVCLFNNIADELLFIDFQSGDIKSVPVGGKYTWTSFDATSDQMTCFVYSRKSGKQFLAEFDLGKRAYQIVGEVSGSFPRSLSSGGFATIGSDGFAIFGRSDLAR